MITTLADAWDERLFGGKAAQLGASVRAGLPVPPGFALSVDQVHAIVQGDTAVLDAAFDAATRLGVVAVRSSAVGEDGAAASYAGQHATVLDIRTRAAMNEAVECVWASGRTAAALGYRQHLGLPGEPLMAVVVQQLVASDTAGVMFTHNPLSGEDERVVEAAWGLGEIVVAGLVTPDRYRMARDGRILERTPGEKDIAIRSATAGGTQEYAVEAHQIFALCLDDPELKALGDLALRCESHHGKGPHDIEFAFAGGALFMLQCRSAAPIPKR